MVTQEEVDLALGDVESLAVHDVRDGTLDSGLEVVESHPRIIAEEHGEALEGGLPDILDGLAHLVAVVEHVVVVVHTRDTETRDEGERVPKRAVTVVDGGVELDTVLDGLGGAAGTGGPGRTRASTRRHGDTETRRHGSRTWTARGTRCSRRGCSIPRGRIRGRCTRTPRGSSGAR